MFSTRVLVSTLLVAVLAVGAIAEEPIKVSIAAHPHLNDATALDNKNTAMHSQNVALTRSNVRGQQDDTITMGEQATDADSEEQPRDVPTGLVLTGDRDTLKQEGEEADSEQVDGDEKSGEMPAGLTLTGERDALTSPDVTEEGSGGELAKDDEQEELEQRRPGGFVGYRRRFFYPRFRGGYYGWRYPLPYWRRYGRRFYGANCPFGRVYGGYFYC